MGPAVHKVPNLPLRLPVPKHQLDGALPPGQWRGPSPVFQIWCSKWRVRGGQVPIGMDPDVSTVGFVCQLSTDDHLMGKREHTSS